MEDDMEDERKRFTVLTWAPGHIISLPGTLEQKFPEYEDFKVEHEGETPDGWNRITAVRIET